MKVKLLAHTPEPEKLVAAAAKNCYSFTDVDSVLDGLTEEKTQSFVHMLSRSGMKARSSMCRLHLRSRACRVRCSRRSRGTAWPRFPYSPSGM